MDFKELGINTIQYLVANIPQIMVVLTAIFTGFKSLNSNVDSFMRLSKETGKTLKKEILVAVDGVKTELIKGIEKTVEKTEQTLGRMETVIEAQAKVIKHQGQKITSLIENVEKLEQTVLLTIELLNETLSQDPEKIRRGVSQKFNEKIKENRMTNDEKETEI